MVALICFAYGKCFTKFKIPVIPKSKNDAGRGGTHEIYQDNLSNSIPAVYPDYTPFVIFYRINRGIQWVHATLF